MTRQTITRLGLNREPRLRERPVFLRELNLKILGTRFNARHAEQLGQFCARAFLPFQKRFAACKAQRGRDAGNEFEVVGVGRFAVHGGVTWR